MRVKLYLITAAVAMMGCESSNIEETVSIETERNDVHLFESLSPSVTGVSFKNDVHYNEEVNHLTWDALYYGGGVAVGDVNGDGKPDLFFTGNQVSDALYLNDGDMMFSDVSDEAGIKEEGVWSNGVAMGDVNGDGWIDIYVCRSSWKLDEQDIDMRANRLWVNNGDGTFTDKAKELGVANVGYSTQVTFFDYDHDNDLDIFLLNAPSNNLEQKVKYNASGFPDWCSDRLYRNDGDHFTDVSEKAGVKAFSFGLGVIATDIDHDGWVDLYVANDYERPDYLYINQGDGTFKNELNSKIKHTCFTAMGCDAGDINNDGLSDLVVLDMQSPDHRRSKTNMPSMQPKTFWSYVDKGYNYQYMSNVLQVNHGAGYFSDIAQLAGVASTDWSWASLLVDLDQDGYKDLYVTNGINYDIRNNDFALEFESRLNEGQHIDLFELSGLTPSTRISNNAFRNRGDLTFEKIHEDWGLSTPSFSYGAAVGDLDGDGDPDLVVCNNNDHPFIYKNNTESGWLQIDIDGPTGNADGYGAKAFAFTEGQIHYEELTVIRGYQSSSEPLIQLGLGSARSLDSLIVIYPDGKYEARYGVEAQQRLVFDHSKAQSGLPKVYDFKAPLFADMSASSGIDFLHREDGFDDYANEIILPHRQSRTGPAMAIGDMNGDGLEDLFLGGAAKQSGVIYHQRSNGTFSMIVDQTLAKDANYEDVAAELLDVDGDGDLDLYVASGGYHLPPGDLGYLDRLYLNQGDGSFKRTELKVPPSNVGCLAAGDYDHDGDLDLFVGGATLPASYPRPDQSFLLRNDKGRFTLASEDFAFLNAPISGPMKTAFWQDLDGDQYLELVCAGEWTAPVVCDIDAALVQPLAVFSDPNALNGWWQRLLPVDIDNDGDLDIIAGNTGTNNKFHVDASHPLKIYAGDHDGNGSNDPVLSKVYRDHFVPVRGRECSSQQMPYVSEKYTDFESFANASIEEMLGESIADAYYGEVQEFRSGVFVNEGGTYRFAPFPNEAQLSAVTGVYAADFDGDGAIDIVLAGNNFDAEVETTRYDAGNGTLLMGDGQGNFTFRDYLESGFYAPSNVKSMAPITLATGRVALVMPANNDRIICVLTSVMNGATAQP